MGAEAGQPGVGSRLAVEELLLEKALQEEVEQCREAALLEKQQEMMEGQALPVCEREATLGRDQLEKQI